MGGDGGTLNNSRHEHTNLRNRILNRPDVATQAAQRRQRASTTHCALTDDALQPPHVVADRLGQLYNKEALLRHMIRRASLAHREGPSGWGDALAHIRAVKKDTVAAQLRAGPQRGAFVCPVTARTVVAEGRFSLGWRCGCVVADGTPLEADGSGAGAWATSAEGDAATTRDDADVRECLMCGEVGERIRLGMTLDERQAVQRRILQARAQRKADARGGKRKRKTVGTDSVAGNTGGANKAART